MPDLQREPSHGSDIMKLDHIAVDTVAFDFNRHGGNLMNFVIRAEGGAAIRPLHTAPWVDEAGQLAEDIPLVERQLSGDFFCAPFGASAGPPIHGWTANGNWQQIGTEDKDGSVTKEYRLTEQVSGASVTKSLTLRSGHRFLYQRHRFDGGSGHLPVAHHAMIRVPGGARLSFSEKQFGVTPNAPLETNPEGGHSMLAYPQRFGDLGAVRTSDGKTVDAGTYPFSKSHEDIVVLANNKDAAIGWSAALAEQDGFLFFAIKEATALPETILWMSNGGRRYAPWLGRHTCVLGIEEAATSCHQNSEFSSTGETSESGLATGMTLQPSAVQEVRYGFGAIPAPEGWTEVAGIRIDKTSITLLDVGGDTVTLPFDGAHFGI